MGRASALFCTQKIIPNMGECDLFVTCVTNNASLDLLTQRVQFTQVAHSQFQTPFRMSHHQPLLLKMSVPPRTTTHQAYLHLVNSLKAAKATSNHLDTVAVVSKFLHSDDEYVLGCIWLLASPSF